MCVSILLGQDFARTSKNLQQKLDEVQHLSEEKQQILSAQKETLEYQVKERTEELSLKNRELEIETALERVRVLMMQMQHSHELPNTTAKIFDELKGLNLLPADAALMLSLIDPEKGVSKHWATGEEFQGEAEEHQIPMHEHPLLIQTLEAWKQQEPVLIRDLSGTELHEFLQYLLNLPALKNSDLVKNRWTPLPDRLIWTETTFSQGLLSVLSSVPLAEESISIQTRFAKVFEMTYRRFLELQKAENQAREAQIEAALETVRSRTMAMHKSEELQDVVNAIFEQFKVLKIEISTANILVFLENSQDINCWTSNYKDRSFHIPFANVPVLMDLHQAKQNGQKLLSKSYTIGDKNQLFEYFFEKTDFRDIPAERQKQIFSSDKYALSSAFSSNVAIQLTSYSRDSFSEGENKILLRFADAFFQAYTRFLDLQKVENQAREAQIEVALERVRSRTMAMYKSEELSEVAAVLFQQIRLLGELPDRLSIGIFEEENDRAQVWTTDQTGFQLSGRFFARLDEETSVQKMYPCWKSGQKTQIIDLQGEEFKKWLKFVKEELKINVDETRFQGRRVHNIAYFSHGWLDVLALEPISQEMLGILLRFANVFSLSYTRFLDLQRAEKQTREARIEASLVRIRAEIASMRGPEDLQHITPLIWKELTTLQVPFFRCGVFIVDEALEKVHTYLSTPDGQAIASFYLPFDSEGPTSQIVAHWRKQQIFLDDWDELQFQAWAQSLVKQGVIPSSETYTSYMPARLFLHFIPFLQGMLYVGGEAPLTPEETQVVQSLTAAFATAYARYQDFTKLEAAKQQVESTLKELQATQAQLIQAEKLASLGELTAGIAHEIQNPLNFVNNFAEVSTEMLDEMKEEIKAGNTSEVIAIADYLEQNLTKINHHGQRASSIVKGMLEHSRASTGRDAMHRVSTDINALADEYLRLAYHGLRAKDDNFNCKLETHFDSDLPLVSVIPQDIGRVLLNLINNAFYAVAERSRSTVAERSRSTVGAPLAGAPTPYQPTVTVSTQKTDDQIIISVQDNGDGIPEAIHNKIFQPFFTTKPTGQGTGLGLSLAYDIVTKGHGGKFNFQSNPGQGTTFFIWLPIPG
ncbi:MAG: ATP-binding protein [Haliscomenobacter sp.]|uniref:sensor histidine kinase n=1 Tax=Haliscomenobacter sp. TaxID=2717303 RepID=UPI0029A7C955|nr:ATP-binding protein [Haliscomenobacter sp.]MDX2066973.1 ATP-binding protein [Haliscomenobacter sp.]